MSNKSNSKKYAIFAVIPILIAAYFLIRPDHSQNTNPKPTTTPKQKSGSKNSWKNISAKQRESWLKGNLAKAQSPKTKAEAEKLLKELDVEAVPLLIDLGYDKKYRQIIINRLRVLAKNKDVVDSLYSELKSDDSQDIILAVRSLLPKGKDERYINMVISLLNSKKPDVVAEMLQILQIRTMKSDKAVDALLGMFPGQQFSDNRLIMALGYQGNSRAVGPLTNHYNDLFLKPGNEHIVRRMAVIHALGEIGNPEAIQSISRIPLAEEHDFVLMSAVEAINRIAGRDADVIRNDNPAIIDTLIALLDSERTNLYTSINSTLGVITGKTVELNSNATAEEAREAASRWRELINN